MMRMIEALPRDYFRKMVTHEAGDTAALNDAAFKNAVMVGCAETTLEAAITIRICRTANLFICPPQTALRALAISSSVYRYTRNTLLVCACAGLVAGPK